MMLLTVPSLLNTMLPQLNLLKMPVNVLHIDAYRTMQDILNQMDNIRTELQTKLNDFERRIRKQKERQLS